MDIVLVRHGKAETISEDGSDFTRHLSDEGRNEVLKLSDSLKSLKVDFGIILSSPFLRAFETSQIISQTLGIKDISISEFLIGNADPKTAVDYILSFTDSIIVVSHMPLVSDITNLILNQRFHFQTASYIHITKVGEGFKISSKYAVD